MSNLRCLLLLLKRKELMTKELVSFCKGQCQGSGECGKGHLTSSSLTFRFFHAPDEQY